MFYGVSEEFCLIFFVEKAAQDELWRLFSDLRPNNLPSGHPREHLSCDPFRVDNPTNKIPVVIVLPKVDI